MGPKLSILRLLGGSELLKAEFGSLFRPRLLNESLVQVRLFKLVDSGSDILAQFSKISPIKVKFSLYNFLLRLGT